MSATDDEDQQQWFGDDVVNPAHENQGVSSFCRSPPAF